ncbi:MAG: hypothetical protein AB7I30_05605 [Isosphaeraceae bacterium]
MTKETKQKPVHKVRIGTIVACVWRNETEHGPRFNVTVERLYKEKDSEEWKQSNSFDFGDLLTLAKVIDLAHTRIHEQAKGEWN